MPDATFWTAVGSLAAVATACTAVVRRRAKGDQVDAASGAPSAELVELQPVDVSVVTQSRHGLAPTEITFVNTAHERAEIFWLDYSGHPMSYGVVTPGETRRVSTFVTHPWEVQLDGGPVRRYLPRAGPGLIVIRERGVTDGAAVEPQS
jgi:hypothetical protein